MANAALVIKSEVPGKSLFEISGDLSGSIPALVAFANEQQPDAMKNAKLPLDLSALKGGVTLSLVSTIVLDKATGATKSVDYAINGVVQDFGSTAPLQGRTIGNGQLSFLVSQAGYRLYRAGRGRWVAGRCRGGRQDCRGRAAAGHAAERHTGRGRPQEDGV